MEEDPSCPMIRRLVMPATMGFNRLSKMSDKDKTGILPKYFSRQLTAFDLTLDLLMRNNKAEVLADSRLTQSMVERRT